MPSNYNSYATVHWPFSSDEQPQPDIPEIIDVARLEDVFWAKGNAYAQEGNFDYANRVIRTGAQLVDLALSIVTEPDGEARQATASGARIYVSQIYQTAEDRCRIPRKDMPEYSQTSDLKHIPEELLTFLNDTWYKFAEDYAIDLKVGYEQHWPKQ